MSNILFKTILLKGEQGNTIASIEKTATSGLVDTYTITLNDGSTSTFEVTNGKDGKEIVSIDLTAQTSLGNTFTVTFNDGSTTDFTIPISGGLLPLIYITSQAGSTITLTKPSGATVTAQLVSGSTTLWETTTDEYGVHTITATNGEYTKTSTIDIQIVKTYETSIYPFDATITVTYPEGATCQLTGTDYDETATDNPETFRVWDVGTYTITVVDNGVTSTDTVEITADGQTESIEVGWLNATVTLYSAVSDTVSYTDANGSQTATTDTSGEATGVSVKVLASSPSVTFTSSIAVNPSDTSSYYSKAITITNGMTEAYVMPDNIIYWYGFKDTEWTLTSASSNYVVSYNTNLLTISMSGSVTQYTTAYVDTDKLYDFTNSTYLYALTGTASNSAVTKRLYRKGGTDQYTTITQNSLLTLTFSEPTEGGLQNNYVQIYLYPTSTTSSLTIAIKAIWYE